MAIYEGYHCPRYNKTIAFCNESPVEWVVIRGVTGPKPCKYLGLMGKCNFK